MLPFLKLFYLIKPFMPRRLQIALRQRLALYKRRKVGDFWPIDPKAGDPPPHWRGWPNGKRIALVLTHDVDTQKGHDRCYKLMDLEEELGFRSSFYFVPQRYKIAVDLINDVKKRGFEVGVHGLNHDGKLYFSEKIFNQRATKINEYIKQWKAVGFRSPAMHRKLEWIHALDIQYDLSTFDTDPFEAQPDGTGTIFPFWVASNHTEKSGYVELPYTLVQDFTLFILMREESIDIWKRKLEWIASHKGMALLNTHPDYMAIDGASIKREEYPLRFYRDFLIYVKTEFAGQFWNALPAEVSEMIQSQTRARRKANFMFGRSTSNDPGP